MNLCKFGLILLCCLNLFPEIGTKEDTNKREKTCFDDSDVGRGFARATDLRENEYVKLFGTENDKKDPKRIAQWCTTVWQSFNFPINAIKAKCSEKELEYWCNYFGNKVDPGIGIFFKNIPCTDDSKKKLVLCRKSSDETDTTIRSSTATDLCAIKSKEFHKEAMSKMSQKYESLFRSASDKSNWSKRKEWCDFVRVTVKRYISQVESVCSKKEANDITNDLKVFDPNHKIFRDVKCDQQDGKANVNGSPKSTTARTYMYFLIVLFYV